MAPVSPGATEEGGCWDMQGSITSPLPPPLPSRCCQHLCLGCLRVTTLLQVGVGSDPGLTDVTWGYRCDPGLTDVTWVQWLHGHSPVENRGLRKCG